MAANSSFNLTSLDFDTLKNDFKFFMQNQSVFRDYNFDGSNINVLLDLLSYNTFKNAFYLNMVASEMFMDSAQKYESVVSHAKELNYLPQSAKSSTATVNFTIDTVGTQKPFTIPKGTLFSGTNSNGSFTFSTDQSYYFNSTNSTYSISNLAISEGVYVQDSFIVDYNLDNQIFTLSNPNIDINTLSVIVTESNNNTTFQQAKTLFDLNSYSNVYFVQAAQNTYYEFVFGDNLFGRIPSNMSVVTANYKVTSGSAGNGITSFTCDEDLGQINFGVGDISTITVTSNSTYGADPQTTESIRFVAPRYYAAQQRAVASDDYKSLILSEFGGEVSDVNVYGGETLTPPQYGRVAISLKPASGLIAANYLKDQITSYFEKYVSIPTRVLMTDPEYLYMQININVLFDSTQTVLYPNDIQNKVINTIVNFSTQNLEKFTAPFYASRFSAAVDNSDTSIISNTTSVRIIRRLAPIPNNPFSQSLDFTNPIEVETYNDGYQPGPRFYDEPRITSSFFTYIDSTGNRYPLAALRDDNFGGIVAYTMNNGTFTIVNNNAGTIDYSTGIMQITDMVIDDYGSYLSVYADGASTNIYSDNNKIIVIDPSDVTVNVTAL